MLTAVWEELDSAHSSILRAMSHVFYHASSVRAVAR